MNGDLDGTKHPNRLNINCEKCNGINKIELHDSEVEEKQVLGTLHSGIGFTHLEGILSIVGLPCMRSAKCKKKNRKGCWVITGERSTGELLKVETGRAEDRR